MTGNNNRAFYSRRNLGSILQITATHEIPVRPSVNPAFTGNVILGNPNEYFNPNAFIVAAYRNVRQSAPRPFERSGSGAVRLIDFEKYGVVGTCASSIPDGILQHSEPGELCNAERGGVFLGLRDS
jgi:hypothetical protein